jgi:hypothetical protein
VFYVKIGKCFSFDKERKTLSCNKRQFFLLTGKNFPLTNFPDGCQTWKNKENGFQKFVFLETNNALKKKRKKSKCSNVFYYHFYFATEGNSKQRVKIRHLRANTTPEMSASDKLAPPSKRVRIRKL